MGIPSVNIGSRQAGRERAENVIDVGPSAQEIETAILSQLRHGRFEPSTLYGDGQAGKKMAEILARIDLNISKTFHEG
jgi:UDP-N-acetylglucosamine 2-epimerase